MCLVRMLMYYVILSLRKAPQILYIILDFSPISLLVRFDIYVWA